MPFIDIGNRLGMGRKRRQEVRVGHAFDRLLDLDGFGRLPWPEYQHDGSRAEASEFVAIMLADADGRVVINIEDGAGLLRQPESGCGSTVRPFAPVVQSHRFSVVTRSCPRHEAANVML